MMDTPLRAYLMLRSTSGEWSVSVCRDLGAIVQAWKSAIEAEEVTGLLHIGFSRPPARHFDAVAQSWVGKVLLTEAARHALPPVFRSSDNPVALIDGRGIFVGLQGWGYDLDDPSAEVQTEPAKVAAPVYQGWLALYVAEHPQHEDVLSKHGIFDDAAYLAHEGELDRSTKHKLGVYRMHSLIPRDCDDPCEMARAAPPWLLEREITSLELPVRANNVFKNCNISLVRDLCAWTPELLLKQQNFGRKSLKDAVIALTAAASEGPVGVLNGQDLSNSSRLLVEVRRSLLSFPERERDVMTRRLGFECPAETLQQVADDYNVTRERIRQIEAKSSRRWIKESFWDDVLLHKMGRLLTGRQSPLPVAGIEALDDWFEGVGDQISFFQNLVQLVCGEKLSVIEINHVHYLTFMSQDVWDRTVSAAEELLSSATGLGWNEAYAQSLVQGLLPDNAREFGSLLWDRSTERCYFSTNADGSRTLTSFGRGAEQVVEAILAESPKPLHYSEIAELVRVKHGREIDVRRAHNAAASVGFLFGRGVYGLERHIPLNEAELAAIRAEAEEIILTEAPDKQWHCSELLRVILERLDREYVGLDKYILDIALRGSESLQWLHRMTWVAKGSATSEQSRIDIHQAIVSFVKAAGRPLSSREIKQNLAEARGINETYAISAADPLIRVGDGLWGLNDRDIPIKRNEQRILIDMLVEHLEDTQHGLFGEEIAEVLELNGCPIQTFLTIAHQDSRIKVSVGRCVYLTKWNSPRRETVGRSVEMVLQEAQEPLSLETITMLASQRMGRMCSKVQVSAALQALEAVFDDATKTWMLAGAQPDTDDDDLPDLSNDNAALSPPETSLLHAGSGG